VRARLERLREIDGAYEAARSIFINAARERAGMKLPGDLSVAGGAAERSS
jgi:hypothetical protein